MGGSLKEPAPRGTFDVQTKGSLKEPAPRGTLDALTNRPVPQGTGGEGCRPPGPCAEEVRTPIGPGGTYLGNENGSTSVRAPRGQPGQLGQVHAGRGPGPGFGPGPGARSPVPGARTWGPGPESWGSGPEARGPGPRAVARGLAPGPESRVPRRRPGPRPFVPTEPCGDTLGHGPCARSILSRASRACPGCMPFSHALMGPGPGSGAHRAGVPRGGPPV